MSESTLKVANGLPAPTLARMNALFTWVWRVAVLVALIFACVKLNGIDRAAQGTHRIIGNFDQEKP